MSVLGPLLAFGSALSYAGFDVARKRVGRHLDPLALTAWLQVVSLPFFLAWVAVTGWSWSSGWWAGGISSIVLQAAANAIFLWALTIAPLSRTVPFLALTPVLSSLSAWLLVGEAPGSRALVGMALVTVGAFALALLRTNEGRVHIEKGSLLTILVAAMWSAGGAVDKRALEFTNPASHATLVALGVLVVFGLERALRGGFETLRVPSLARGELIVAGVFGCAALGLQLAAYDFMLVSGVETMKRAVGGGAALLLGKLAFGENIEASAVVAVAVMSVGTVLVLV